MNHEYESAASGEKLPKRTITEPGFIGDKNAMKGCAKVRFIYGMTLAVLLVFALPAHARPVYRHGESAPHPHGGAHLQHGNGGFHRQGPSHEPRYKQNRGHYLHAQRHPGREHLPQWYRQHQHMSFQQQERALRREPGFNRLTPAQRKRVLRSLRYLDSQPPAVRRRIMARNEAFERLSPERKQEVRAAAQAFQRMPRYRKQQLGRAFNYLSTLRPGQRRKVLHSARFKSKYSARERHILGNLLSIEPWQPTQHPEASHPSPKQ